MPPCRVHALSHITQYALALLTHHHQVIMHTEGCARFRSLREYVAVIALQEFLLSLPLQCRRASDSCVHVRAQVYAALNAIGEVAWSINGPVVDALKHAGDEGMLIGNMPIQEDLPLTPTPRQRIFAVQSHTYPRTRMTVSVSTAPSQRILRPSLCQD